ncbi:uncharacterized protein [Panulirus ornatus]|uniref:uncharacterized protein n=1 Tax=Panulirus ornatus TaxID=150431 RepID=UPI003A8AA2CA
MPGRGQAKLKIQSDLPSRQGDLGGWVVDGKDRSNMLGRGRGRGRTECKNPGDLTSLQVHCDSDYTSFQYQISELDSGKGRARTKIQEFSSHCPVQPRPYFAGTVHSIMPGRGRAMAKNQGETLRRPGQTNTGDGNEASKVKDLLDRIVTIKSPDDLQVGEVASEVKNAITEEEDLRWFAEELCNHGLSSREHTPVAAKLFGLIAHHQAGDCKILTFLMRRVQEEYNKRDDLILEDRSRFVTSALFLGEVYHHVKTEKKSPFHVLADPVLKYLDMIIEPHLSDNPNEDIDSDMLVVSKQLLQSGAVLHETRPDGIVEVVQKVTEVLCRCQLSISTRLNLLAGLAGLWPILATSDINTRTQHASLAAKLGVCLHI